MNIRALVASALLAAVAALSVRAAELPIKQLPANTAGVVDIDAKTYRSSDVGKLLEEETKKLGEAGGPFAQFQQTGLEADDADRLILAYGFAGQESFAVYLFGEKLNQAKLDAIVASAEKQSGETSGKSLLGERSVSTVKTASPNGDTGSMNACLAQPGLIVISGTIENLQLALDVIDGKAASLDAMAPVARLAKPSTVSMFSWLGLYLDGEAQAFKDSPLAANPQAQQIKAIRAVLSGEMNNVALKLDGKFDSAENAAQMQQMLMGIKAMATMGDNVDPVVMQILGNLKVSSEGTWAMAETSLPASMLVEQIRKAASMIPAPVPAADQE